ncbi:SMI1/KNR4 family protein [Micromonospora sp. NPDC005174]|uniref:SMI1/KNR4 family protein n=1 Tax=unclassified Micromonospora TaxID=2617518 RepID=UPI0033B6F858
MWDVEDIQARLAVMRAEDPELRRSGARRHRYQLGATLSEADLAAFECHHHITLPDAYRSFLREVGNGGAGPHYGLFTLDGDGLRDHEREARHRPGYLATPFPHTQAWNPAYHVPDPCVPGPVDLMTEDEYFDEREIAGSLIIAEFGCGAFHRLIITGPARGQVWFDDRAADGGLSSEADFADWYQDWLHDRE